MLWGEEFEHWRDWVKERERELQLQRKRCEDDDRWEV